MGEYPDIGQHELWRRTERDVELDGRRGELRYVAGHGPRDDFYYVEFREGDDVELVPLRGREILGFPTGKGGAVAYRRFSPPYIYDPRFPEGFVEAHKELFRNALRLKKNALRHAGGVDREWIKAHDGVKVHLGSGENGTLRAGDERPFVVFDEGPGKKTGVRTLYPGDTISIISIQEDGWLKDFRIGV